MLEVLYRVVFDRIETFLSFILCFCLMVELIEIYREFTTTAQDELSNVKTTLSNFFGDYFYPCKCSQWELH